MDSGGLPGAPLVPVLGRPAVSHAVELLRRPTAPGADGVPAISEIPVVLVTTDRHADDPIASYAASASLPVFRGPAGDAAGRLLVAARQFELDWMVALDENAAIVDPQVVQQAVAEVTAGQPDRMSNVPNGTVPRGAGVSVCRTELLAGSPSRDAAERWHALGQSSQPGLQGVRLSLDTPADRRLLEFCLRHVNEEPTRSVSSILDGLLERYSPPQPWVGSHGPLLVAEIGSNHEGDFGRARVLTEQAIAVRPDFVKFQIYTGDSLVSPVAAPDRHGHFRKFELTRDQHLELAHMCGACGVGYMASVWDMSALDWIDPVLEIYKVGSGDLVATGILRKVAARGKPILLSTGLATEREVLDAVDALVGVDDRYRRPEWLALLQCTSAYPIESRDANLAVMRRLHELTGLPAGYSDHTEGTVALEVAAAAGARILEFHFTDRRADPSFRDHRVSLVPDEVTRLQRYCDTVVRLTGSSRKRLLDVEESTGQLQGSRRGLYPARDLPSGHRLGVDDLVALRPNQGIDAREVDRLVGRRIVRALSALAPIQWADLREE